MWSVFMAANTLDYKGEVVLIDFKFFVTYNYNSKSKYWVCISHILT